MALWSRCAPSRTALVWGALCALPIVAVAQRPDLPELQAEVQRDSNDAEKHYRYGLVLVDKEKYERADTAFRASIAIDPRHAEAFLALAYLPYLRRSQLRSEERRGRVPDDWKPVVDEARRFYRRAFVLNPFVSLRVLSVMFPPARWGNERDYTSGASRFYELFVEGFDELASAHNAKAYMLLDQLAKQVFRGDAHPDDVPDFVLWARGMAAARMRKDTAAIADFQALLTRSLKIEQRNEIIPVPLRTNEYRFILAAIHEQAGDTAQAVALFQEAATADLGLDMAHVRIANILHARGDFAAELKERDAAVASNPDDPVALFELALLLFDAGELETADGHLQRARELGPRDARFPYLLGVIAQAQQRAADAKKWYQLCVDLAPVNLAQIASDARTRLAGLR